jgi:hypothetical protein
LVIKDIRIVNKPTRQPGALPRLGIEGQVIPTLGHSDESISLTLDEGIALARSGSIDSTIFRFSIQFQMDILDINI